MRTFGLYVNGQYVQTPFYRPLNPPAHPDKPLGRCAYLRQEDSTEILEAALQGASETFDQIVNHGFFPLHERLESLKRFREKLSSNKDFLATLLCQEVGKPLQLARAELQRSLDTCDWTLAQAPQVLSSEGLPVGAKPAWDKLMAWSWREPRGPLLAITPFNFPVNLVLHKLVPALAVGCPVILKPSPKAAATALAIADTFHAAGLPPGMLSVLNTDDALAARLAEDSRVTQISFTGSAAVGWNLSKRVAKPCYLEMGGNAPVFVDASADLPICVEKIVNGAFSYSGQLCIAVQNVTLHPAIETNFKTLLKEAVAKMPWGLPDDESVIAGGVIDSAAAERLTQLKDSALKAGARIVCEAGSPKGLENTSNPTFLKPAVFENLPREHPLVQEEMFGPYLNIDVMSDWKAWKNAVNPSAYRFQASIFTNDLNTALAAARDIHFGSVFVNESTHFRMEPMPFGGRGRSGNSSEGPRYAMESFTELKNVALRFNG